MRWHWIVLGVAGLLATGCTGGDSGPEKFAVSGTVKFDGQPIAKGEIRFVPADSKGVTDAAQIKDGAYTVQTTPGAKKVEVHASREVPGKTVPSGVTPGATEPLIESYIPEKYNTKTELKKDVSAKEETGVDFDLKP